MRRLDSCPRKTLRNWPEVGAGNLTSPLPLASGTDDMGRAFDDRGGARDRQANRTGQRLTRAKLNSSRYRHERAANTLFQERLTLQAWKGCCICQDHMDRRCKALPQMRTALAQPPSLIVYRYPFSGRAAEPCGFLEKTGLGRRTGARARV